MRRAQPDLNRLYAATIFWAMVGLRRRGLFQPDPGDAVHDGYNIYVDAKNGNNANSGLFEHVPVKTIHRAGLVMRGLPSDRETKGVRIWLWGSDAADPETLYRDYNDVDTGVGLPKSSFIGMNNYWISTNPKTSNLAILDGSNYSNTDQRRIDWFNARRNDFFRPAFLYLAGNNITVQKLELTASAGQMIRHSGNNSVFRELHIHHTTADTINSGGSDNLFEYLYIHHVDENLTLGRSSDGVRIQNGVRPTIRYCVTHNVGGEAYNFDDNTHNGLVYLNDAYDLGYVDFYGGTFRERGTGIGYKLSSSITTGARNFAIANRSWRNPTGYYAIDGIGHVFLHNAAFDSANEHFLLRGDNAILLGNNIAHTGFNTRITQTRTNYWPRQFSNSWGNLSAHGSFSKNLDMFLNGQLAATWFKSAVMPDPAPAVGFTGDHFLPIEATFAGIANHGYGFGRHVGPTEEVVAKLRSLTPSQIRDLLKVNL